ncbi:MAG TPA: hypothetical protein VFF06_29940 [Polyangia bacterium]|nr:hypothetical protein [Polyangia bacterium]
MKRWAPALLLVGCAGAWVEGSRQPPRMEHVPKVEAPAGHGHAARIVVGRGVIASAERVDGALPGRVVLTARDGRAGASEDAWLLGVVDDRAIVLERDARQAIAQHGGRFVLARLSLDGKREPLADFDGARATVREALVTGGAPTAVLLLHDDDGIERLIALELDGRRLFEKPLDPARVRTLAASPSAAELALSEADPPSLRLLDARTGAPRWQRKLDAGAPAAESAPAFDGRGDRVFWYRDAHLEGFAAADGAPLGSVALTLPQAQALAPNQDGSGVAVMERGRGGSGLLTTSRDPVCSLTWCSFPRGDHVQLASYPSCPPPGLALDDTRILIAP